MESSEPHCSLGHATLCVDVDSHNMFSLRFSTDRLPCEVRSRSSDRKTVASWLMAIADAAWAKKRIFIKSAGLSIGFTEVPGRVTMWVSDGTNSTGSSKVPRSAVDALIRLSRSIEDGP